MLCVKSIIDNNVDYTTLSNYHQYTIDYEIHKIKFYETLCVMNTIYEEMSTMPMDFLIVKVQVVYKDIEEITGDEKYNFIYTKFLYNVNGQDVKGSKFIQEITDIDFD
jgi:hypothetical protein